MSKRSARREFLRKAAKTLGAAAIAPMAYDSILGHVLNRAYAATTGEAFEPNKMNYIHMNFPGGPPRWMFDLPLTPHGASDKFTPGGFGTRFNAVGEVEYFAQRFVVNGKQIHLPPVWGMKLSNQDFTSLLPNTFFVRGLDMEINNHGLSNARQVAPIIGGYSIGGMLADASGAPLPAVGDMGSNAAQAFRSKRGLAISSISYTESATVNPVGTLLASFKDFRGTRVTHLESRTKAQQKVLAQFERIAESRGIASATLGKMYGNAIELMDKEIIKLSDKWKDTVAKYRAIVDEALHPAKGTLPGLFDKAVSGAPATAMDPAGSKFAFAATNGSVVKTPDLRDMLIKGRTAAPQMAENFAIAELLTGDVSSTMTLSFRPLTGLSRDGSPTALFNMTHDQHSVGVKVSVINTTLFYRAFLGCMTELVKSLKGKGLFDKTVIHVSAEFNRTPREDGSGADHGFMAGNTTLISGMISNVACVGNVVANPSMGRYKGTFGVASHFVSGGFDRAIQVNDVALTITSMLGVETIVTNGRSLLSPSGGGWAPLKEEAKNV